MDGIITAATQQVLGYGILGVYAVIVTVGYFRKDKQLLALYERHIAKKDTKRDQEIKMVTELTSLVRDVLEVADALNRALGALSDRGPDDDNNQKD